MFGKTHQQKLDAQANARFGAKIAFVGAILGAVAGFFAAGLGLPWPAFQNLGAAAGWGDPAVMAMLIKLYPHEVFEFQQRLRSSIGWGALVGAIALPTLVGIRHQTKKRHQQPER